MNDRVHILKGPSGSGKTARLVEACAAFGKKRTGTPIWIGPSRRRLEQLRPSLANVPEVKLTTFGELAAEILATERPDLRPLSRSQSRLLVDEVLSELSQHIQHYSRVLETRGFTSHVIALLSELQRQDITPELFAAATTEGELAAIYALYVRKLQESGWCDFDTRMTHCLDVLLANPQAQFWKQRYAVFVDDFRSFSPPERELLNLFGDRCEELWIALPGEENSDRIDLFTRASFGTSYSVLGTPTSSRPAGLSHLERNLFRPVRMIRPATDADGIHLIQAPGVVGEARMAARRIKTLLREGVAADSILVSVHDLTPYADLLREVFDEYGIPIDVEGTDPLQRDPTVSLLLRVLRLPEDDWPFASVTALLRSNWLQPNWPEMLTDPSLPLLSEALMRLLAIPRGREEFLGSARRWAAKQQEGLEDEQAEESRRRRTHELAKQCLPFLERFFRAWEGMPDTTSLDHHLSWLQGFIHDLGLESPSRAWRAFWDEITFWRRREDRGLRPLERRTFHRRLHTLAAGGGTARSQRGAGRVHILSSTMACNLDADYLFLLGLGESSFPNLSLPSPLLDEGQRQTLRNQGLELQSVNDLLSDEMLLFYRLTTRARQQLILSYPAVDARGQPLLPGSFLSSVLDLFEKGVVPVERRNMLIEQYDREAPLSPAEHRVRLAVRLTDSGKKGTKSKTPASLLDAREVVTRRFHSHDFNPYDGWFRDPLAVAEAARMFGPDRVFSPTALEDYVACPFRFFLRHVLRLEPLEEPREEIEMTRRGQMFHRALARLHRRRKEAGTHEPDDKLSDEVHAHLLEAIREVAERAAGPAEKVLWDLEGERLLKLAVRYPQQWNRLLEPWQKLGLQPRPHEFEVGFGMPPEDENDVPHDPLLLRGDGIEVRISGRIDRVDLVENGDEIGFWIIDYKTGRGTHYTQGALARFERLQLTLYALAVEEVVLAGRKARPFGLAYWLVGEDGPKVVLPGKDKTQWSNDLESWGKIRETLRAWILSLVKNIREGVYPLSPRADDCTSICDYGEICRIGQSRSVAKAGALALPMVTPTSSETS